MKLKLLSAAGVALIIATIYYFKNRKTKQAPLSLHKENERHHLTDVFSKAKDLALGN